MNIPTNNIKSPMIIIVTALVCALTTPNYIQAKNGATDPIPGTSNGATNSGGGGTGGGGSGGGSNSNKPNNTVVSTTLPATTTPQQVVTGTLNFTAAASVNDVIPVCTGSYRIDPYYSTLSLMTVSVQGSSVHLPDGTQLQVTVNTTGGTAYPYTTNLITLTAGSGSCTLSQYVTPGTTITSVVVSDLSGTVISAGN